MVLATLGSELVAYTYLDFGDVVIIGSNGQELNVAEGIWYFVAPNHRVWKAQIKWCRIINLLDIVLGEFQAQRIDVSLDVVELATTNNGEDIRCLVHDIGKSDTSHDAVLALGNGLECVADLSVVLLDLDSSTARCVSLLLRLEPAAAQGTPRRNAHAFTAAHGDDFALELAISCRPAALVYAELAEAMRPGVLIGFAAFDTLALKWHRTTC